MICAKSHCHCFAGARLQPRRTCHASNEAFSRRGWSIFPVAVLVILILILAVYSSAEVLRISINDAIQPATAEYIARALEAAAAMTGDLSREKSDA